MFQQVKKESEEGVLEQMDIRRQQTQYFNLMVRNVKTVGCGEHPPFIIELDNDGVSLIHSVRKGFTVVSP